MSNIMIHTLMKSVEFVNNEFDNPSLNILSKFKQIEKRIILVNASEEAFCAKSDRIYDALYHNYCQFRLLRLKIDLEIIDSSLCLRINWIRYMANLKLLQRIMLPRP